MATRTLESRFERMSVNDENDQGEGKYKSKVRNISGLHNIMLTSPLDGIVFQLELSIITKREPRKSPQNCIAKPKHNKHSGHRSFPGSPMEELEHAEWSNVTTAQTYLGFFSWIR